jgi:hypothetical protein
MDLTCPKQMLCRNFPNKCDTCRANSDFINHYPCYEDRDMVEVVRCKDCVFYISEVCRHDLALNLSREDDFCSYGERKEK